MVSCLATVGFDTTIASNGIGAFELLRLMILDKRIPDVFVVDQNIVGISGIELASAIRTMAATAAVPILIVAELPLGELDSLSSLAPALLISKSFTCKEFRSAITRLVGDSKPLE